MKIKLDRGRRGEMTIKELKQSWKTTAWLRPLGLFLQLPQHWLHPPIGNQGSDSPSGQGPAFNSSGEKTWAEFTVSMVTPPSHSTKTKNLWVILQTGLPSLEINSKTTQWHCCTTHQLHLHQNRWLGAHLRDWKNQVSPPLEGAW